MIVIIMPLSRNSTVPWRDGLIRHEVHAKLHENWSIWYRLIIADIMFKLERIKLLPRYQHQRMLKQKGEANRFPPDISTEYVPSYMTATTGQSSARKDVTTGNMEHDTHFRCTSHNAPRPPFKHPHTCSLYSSSN
jgi:hypothetical protein